MDNGRRTLTDPDVTTPVECPLPAARCTMPAISTDKEVGQGYHPHHHLLLTCSSTCSSPALALHLPFHACIGVSIRTSAVPRDQLQRRTSHLPHPAAFRLLLELFENNILSIVLLGLHMRFWRLKARMEVRFFCHITDSLFHLNSSSTNGKGPLWAAWGRLR